MDRKPCWSNSKEPVPRAPNTPPAIQIDRLWPEVCATFYSGYEHDDYAAFSYEVKPNGGGMYTLNKDEADEVHRNRSRQAEWSGRTQDDKDGEREDIREHMYLQGREERSGNV